MSSYNKDPHSVIAYHTVDLEGQPGASWHKKSKSLNDFWWWVVAVSEYYSRSYLVE